MRFGDVTPKMIDGALEGVRKRWITSSRDFTNGDCHAIAIALFETLGCGSLQVCLREELEQSGAVFSTSYSHMVYCDPGGACWDIGGDRADIRWEEERAPDEDAVNKWDLTERLRWEELPYEKYLAWLKSHHARIDRKLIDDIAADLGRVFKARPPVSAGRRSARR